jgi:hypothetical protein
MAVGRADETIARPSDIGLPPVDETTRAIVARADGRRLALQGEQMLLRARYETIMQWVNPPWDPISQQVDPRPDMATAERDGRSKLHVDLTNPAVDRWAVLQAGAPVVFRCKPPYVDLPVPSDDVKTDALNKKKYDIDRMIAQEVSSRIENRTQDWIDANNLNRTLLWAVWAKEAFGKSILRVGYDDQEKIPTAELLENPSTVYYGWDRRYGRRKLAWVAVVEELSALEANRRYGLDMPIDDEGSLRLASWTGLFDQGDMDQRPEQDQTNQRWITAMEYHELIPDPADPKKTVASCSIIVAGRIVEGPHVYPWSKLPFLVLENQHIPTWQHGKSTAEVIIPINAAMDDMLTRQREVIDYESGPRYKGLNMLNSSEEVSVPPPFQMIPLREGEDIAQIDTRVDFFPSELHGNQLYEGIHRGTGLTPIAWGMSPNAQTSGRAMSAEWRAVELPMTGKLVNLSPEVKDLTILWWDIASAYDDETKRLGSFAKKEGASAPYRRFEALWVPLDIRDKTEKTQDVIQRVQAFLLDPETAIEELGHQNGDEIMARIKAYLVDPIYNTLHYQQLLTLQQLELQIRQQELEVSMMEQQAAAAQGEQQAGPPAPGGQPSPGDLAAQGQNAAGQAAQGPAGPVGEGDNQPGMSPGGGGLPLDTSILSQTPLSGGIGNRVVVPLGGEGPAPTAGNQPK